MFMHVVGEYELWLQEYKRVTSEMQMICVKVQYVGFGHLFNLCPKPMRGRISSE